jgi:predicted amidohydrolase YtcJ
MTIVGARSPETLGALALFAVFGAASWARGQDGASAPTTADLVLVNGKIVTVDRSRPQVQALAAKGETIVALGSDGEVRRHVGSATRVIDLQGRLAIPGFIEGHGHFMSLGESLMELELRDARTWDEVVSRVEQAVAKAKPGDWIVGRGWHQDKWERRPAPSVEGLPIHDGLSKASPRNPVFLSHTSGHGVFVNAHALELSGIGRATKNPEGGEIVRDPDGDAIGMLREAAAEPARQALAKWQASRPPAEAERRRREQVRLASENALTHGITSFQDMGSSFADVDLLKKVADEGALPLRLYLALEETAEAMQDKLARYRMVGYGGGYLTVRAIGEKVLDGALGTHGGWLLEPYTDHPRSAGFNVTPVPEIHRSAELALEHGYQMAIQGIGDRAVRVLLDLYKEVGSRHSDPKGLRWRIEHAQVIHPDDVLRFAREGVIPSVQGQFACSDGPWVKDRLGEARTRERGYLFRSLMDSGAVVTNGTDPPVEDIDPIASFGCSVTRQLPDGSIFSPEQRMTREQALLSYTLNNAIAAFEDDVKGSLAVGKLADITVLSKDILTIPDAELRTAEVVYTIVGGKVRYERARTASPPTTLSTMGALCLAAAPASEDRNRLLRQLMAWGWSMALVGGLVCQPLFGYRR